MNPSMVTWVFRVLGVLPILADLQPGNSSRKQLISEMGKWRRTRQSRGNFPLHDVT